MEKLKAILALFKQGHSVVDPALWKNRQITATILAGVILAIINVLAAFGFSIPIDPDTANAIAAGVIGLVNVILTMTTSKKVGIPAVEEPDPLPELSDSTIKHLEEYEKFKKLNNE
jgi:uncharacterized membrane protein